MQEKVWKNLIKSSNSLINNFSANQKKIINCVKTFSDDLVSFSQVYLSDRNAFFIFLKQNYNHFYLQATSIISCADSVSVIMQLNEGINDYLILINLFRQLLVTLDSLSSEYWLRINEKFLDKPNAELIKVLIGLSNESSFEKTHEIDKENFKIIEKNKIKQDFFFKNKMNKSLWFEIKELELKILNKHDGDFEYFKELLSKTEDLADDMVINLWAILAVNISYLEYLNLLVKG